MKPPQNSDEPEAMDSVLRLRCSPDLIARLKRVANANQRTVSGMIRVILTAACDTFEGQQTLTTRLAEVSVSGQKESKKTAKPADTAHRSISSTSPLSLNETPETDRPPQKKRILY